MRNNKAILDEAARSVRRTFIGSVAGTVGMFAVVGAAGAYGMPEKLTAQALSAAMARLSFKFPREPVQAEPLVVVAQLVPKTQPPLSQVSDAPPKSSIVPVVSPTPDPPPLREASVPELPPIVAAVEPAQELAPKPTVSLTPQTLPVVAPRQTQIAAPTVFKAPKVTASVMPPALTDIAEPSPPTPAPTVTASVTPPAHPVAGERGAVVSAPMVFEPPKPADAQVLTELPKTEVVVASLAAEPLPMDLSKDFPKSVMIALPLPKPPLTPAQRLELQGKDYDKAEKCLAQAVYFEARNEPARGQQAVAQVVLNRVFSPYYPKDVCSVVYQNAHHYLGCQFTFACDGKPEAVNEHGPWLRANRIAKQTLDVKIWLPDVDKATHYHAAYVRPKWIRDMKVLARYGLHTFYRPRNWGDGSDEAHWGTPANSAKPAAVTAVKALSPAQKKFAYR
jgi:spore germination cell wall hydrolase CwlJ-like protein